MVLRFMHSDGRLYRAYRALKFVHSNGGLYVQDENFRGAGV